MNNIIVAEAVFWQWHEELGQLMQAALRFHGRPNIEQKLTEAIDCLYAMTDDGATEPDFESDYDDLELSDFKDWAARPMHAGQGTRQIACEQSPCGHLDAAGLCSRLETFMGDGATEPDFESDYDDLELSDFKDWAARPTRAGQGTRQIVCEQSPCGHLDAAGLCIRLETFMVKLEEASQKSSTTTDEQYRQWDEELAALAYAGRRFLDDAHVSDMLNEAIDCLRAIKDDSTSESDSEQHFAATLNELD
jgi:uncharacterized protein (DUF433 family)